MPERGGSIAVAARRARTPSLIVRLAAPVVSVGAVLGGKALVRCGLRRAPEGWRRTLGILLRSEPTRFALSAFGLRAPVDPQAADAESCTAAALRAYLDTQPDAHFALEWRDVITTRRRTTALDVVLLTFGPAGELAQIEPHLAPTRPVPLAADRSAHVHTAIVDAYNGTRHLPEIDRPAVLLAVIGQRLEADSDRPSRGRMIDYARRLLSACCVSFEPMPVGDARFRPPLFATRRGLGFGFLTIVARRNRAQRTIDVWASAHHVGLDGVPLQELVAGLERTWGIAESIAFPSPDGPRPFMAARRCSVSGERRVDEMLAFVDFEPVMALRRAVNDHYAGAIGAPITFGALLAWLLSREPEFAGVRIASTVDVAASDGYERDVDVVPLRPADYAPRSGDWDGLVEYAKEFNRLIAASRTRTSPLRRGLQTAGFLPPWAHAHAVRSNVAALDDTFGSLCVTIIRDAKVFVAPMTDLGLGHGFLAIGDLNLPTADGRRVAAVTIKRDAGRLDESLAALHRVIARCPVLLAGLAAASARRDAPLVRS